MSEISGNKIVAMTAGLAAAGTLILSGCSNESAPPQPLQPQDASPLVADYVATHPAEDDLLFDPADITSALQNSTLPEGRTTWYDPPLKQSVNVVGSDYTPSAQMLEVHADASGNLHYQASDLLPARQLNQLLHDVNQRRDILQTAMKPDATGKIALDTITFRVFDTRGPAGADVPGGPAYGVDIDAPDKSKLYYFLSGDKVISNDEIPEMLGHEAFHALLGQRTGNTPLTPEQKTRLDGACKVLAKSAINELMIQDGYQQTSSLDTLRDAVDAPYKPAFDRVKAALEDGTYTDLPKSSTDVVPSCVLEPPTFAVNKQVTLQGLDVQPMIKTIMGESADSMAGPLASTTGAMVDGFFKVMRDSDAFHNQAESTYLPPGTAPNVGHPSDDSAENEASSGNVAVSNTEDFLEHMRYVPDEVRQAEGTVLQIDAEVVATRYPGSAIAKQIETVAKRLNSGK